MNMWCPLCVLCVLCWSLEALSFTSMLGSGGGSGPCSERRTVHGYLDNVIINCTIDTHWAAVSICEVQSSGQCAVTHSQHLCTC